MSGSLSLDLRVQPFSRRGTWWSLAKHEQGPFSPKRTPGLYLRTHHYNTVGRDIFRIAALSNQQEVPAQITATAVEVGLTPSPADPRHRLAVCMPEPHRVRITGKGVGVRLAAQDLYYTGVTPIAPGAWEIRVSSHNILFTVTLLAGRGTPVVHKPDPADKLQTLVLDITPDLAGHLDLTIDDNHTVGIAARNVRPVAQDLVRVETEWQLWLDRVVESTPALSVSDAAQSARALAAYTNWASIVSPMGFVRRPAMLMSRNWMDRVWSWDHCFNALAVAPVDPALAWDQFCLFFDHQDEQGVWPDLITDDHRAWGHVKPPVHGWTLGLLMKHPWLTRDHLAQAYPALCRQVEFWLTHRDADRDGIPGYHHGCDSGWDNATCFDLAGQVESPDLSALLILQMDVLADVARRLGIEADAGRWSRHADALLRRLIEHNWMDGVWKCPRSGDHATASAGDSLLPYVTLVLGKRLPESIFDAMVEQLTRPGRFITPHGLATEALDSPLHQVDGYWRGPIWAPPMMLITDGLARGGRNDLASDLAKRFCRMCITSGFAENFDATTGRPLRDRAYTWTASIFLLLAQRYGI